MENTPEQIPIDAAGNAAHRVRLRATLPEGQTARMQLVMISATVLVGAWFAASRLDAPSGADWLVLGVTLLVILFGEWALHRWPMHHRVFPEIVYERHVVHHHVFFTHEQMEIDSPDDLYWVLFPWWGVVVLAAFLLPVGFGLEALLGPNPAWLFVLGVLVYYGVYECTHALAHLRHGSGLPGRLARAIGEHHRIHHDPKLMRRWNFAFAIPLFDIVFGTRWRPPAR